MKLRPPQIVKLRAFVVAQALLFSSLFAPLMLAVENLSDACTMTYCVETGSCCCQPSKPLVRGHYPGGQPAISQAELAAACPEGCITSLLSFNHSQRGTIRQATHQFHLIFSVTTHAPPSLTACATVDLTSRSPRAPPVSLTLV